MHGGFNLHTGRCVVSFVVVARRQSVRVICLVCVMSECKKVRSHFGSSCFGPKRSTVSFVVVFPSVSEIG